MDVEADNPGTHLYKSIWNRIKLQNHFTDESMKESFEQKNF